MSQLMAGVIGVGAFGFIFLVIFVVVFGSHSKCPTCNRWFGRSRLGPKRLSHTAHEQRVDSSTGRVSSVERKIYKANYTCRFCSHEWEGFV